MNLGIKAIIVTLLIVFSSFCENSNLLACTCLTWDFDYASDKASEIFLAAIISVEGTIDNPPQITKFRILKKWKGNNEKKVTIYSEITGCDILLSRLFSILNLRQQRRFNEKIKRL